jgi:hypothetical protein
MLRLTFPQRPDTVISDVQVSGDFSPGDPAVPASRSVQMLLNGVPVGDGNVPEQSHLSFPADAGLITAGWQTIGLRAVNQNSAHYTVADRFTLQMNVSYTGSVCASATAGAQLMQSSPYLCDPGGGGSLGPCLATIKADTLNVRAAPGISFSQLETVHQGEQLTLVARALSPLDGGLWYRVSRDGEVLGWVSGNPEWIELLRPICAELLPLLEYDSDGNLLSTPTPTPTVDPNITPTATPTPQPPLACIPHVIENGILTSEFVSSDHDAPAYKNLLPPCDLDGQPMIYIGPAVTPDPRFDRQYDVMNAASAQQIEYVRNLHYGPDDPDPIVSPRPTRVPPTPTPPPGETGSQAYQEWFTLWGDTANGAPTEETRLAYERGEILNSDNNSCGFVSLAYGMNYLGISDNVHPYELMISAADCARTNTCTSSIRPHPFGVDLTSERGFGYWHFLNEVDHGVQQSTNAFPADTATLDEINTYVRTPNTALLVLVRIDRNRGDDYEREGVIKRDGGLLTALPLSISHWVVVTGVSEDNDWYRVLNPLNNQIEYYTRVEFEDSRNVSDMDIIRLTVDVPES